LNTLLLLVGVDVELWAAAVLVDLELLLDFL